MVIARNSIIGASIVGGMAGGFALDRDAAKTPLREYRRTPEIARDPNVREEDLTGGAYNLSIAMAPPAAALAAAIIYGGMATGTTFSVERHVSRHPLGMLALATAITGATMTTGVLVSRIGLG